MWRRLFPLYLFAILTAFPAAAAADQVILTNGDRVTGTVASLGGATLMVGTPHGQLRIPWADVAGLVIDEPILITVGTAEPAEVRIIAGTPPAASSSTRADRSSWPRSSRSPARCRR